MPTLLSLSSPFTVKSSMFLSIIPHIPSLYFYSQTIIFYPPLSSCLPPLPHAHPPFPLLPLHCKKLEDSVYNPSYSLPIGGFSNNYYLSHLFGNLPFRRIIHFILCIWRF